jgi:ribosomal protein S6
MEQNPATTMRPWEIIFLISRNTSQIEFLKQLSETAKRTEGRPGGDIREKSLGLRALARRYEPDIGI